MKYLVELNYESRILFDDTEHFNFMRELFGQSIIRLQEIIVDYDADNNRVFYFKYLSSKNIDDILKEIRGLLYPFQQSAIAFRIRAVPEEKYSTDDLSMEGIIGSQVYAPFNPEYFIDDTSKKYSDARTDIFYDMVLNDAITNLIHENSAGER